MKNSTSQTGTRRATRQRRKPRNRRKPNYRLLFSLFCISVAIGCACSYALQAPALVVKEVEVKGILRANRTEVQQAARTVLGRNIILLHKGPVVSRIRAVNEIESVSMGRTFPAKVWVVIKERKAAAVLACGETSFLLQDDGLAFHDCGKALRCDASRPDAPPGVPVIQVADCARVREGARCTSPGVRWALKIAKFAQERRLKVAEISVDRLGDICLNMGSGFYVKLGQPDEMAKKMSLLRKALVYKPSLARDAAYIDLSCPSAPVWKPKTGVGSAS